MQFSMRFPGGKPKALTFSYDDGVYQDLRLIEIFNRYGLKGTFNLNSGLFGAEPGERKSGRMTKEDVLSAYKKFGHEVAIHGFTHPFLEQLSPEQVTKEILEDRKNLEELFCTIIRGGAYPMGTYSDEVVDILKKCGVKYFRTTKSTEKFDIPRDWLRMPATCHHSNEKLFELASRFTDDSPDLREAWRNQAWLFYVWGHSYEFDQNVENNNWERMDHFCRQVSGREDVWYATNMEIYDYIAAFGKLEISLDESTVYNPNSQTVFFKYKNKNLEVRSGEVINLR